ncbi:hypothetical protein OAV21_02560, partial [bacterium]|nr:hypothetical protein [bacterium]
MPMNLKKLIPKELGHSLLIPFIIVGLMWSVEVWDWFLTLLLSEKGESISILDAFGIRPRQFSG